MNQKEKTFKSTYNHIFQKDTLKSLSAGNLISVENSRKASVRRNHAQHVFKNEKKLGIEWTRRKMDKGPEVRPLGGWGNERRPGVRSTGRTLAGWCRARSLQTKTEVSSWRMWDNIFSIMGNPWSVLGKRWHDSVDILRRSLDSLGRIDQRTAMNGSLINLEKVMKLGTNYTY